MNLSARQLQRHEIVREIAQVLLETGLPSECLVLEITESVMMQDMALSNERLTQLKHLGVLLAVDDFGTGYSSLNYIRRFPVDVLKVDKSFVDGVSEGGEESALTAAIIELAGSSNLRPVAEGIERADQLDKLLELGCELGQGYYFSRPLPIEGWRSSCARATCWPPGTQSSPRRRSPSHIDRIAGTSSICKGHASMRARFDAHVVKAASTPILSEQSFIPTRIREEAVMSQRTDVRRSVVAPSPTEATEATTSFVNLGVSRPVADALRMRGIAEAFPIQSLVLRDAIAGRDVLARSSTGSGRPSRSRSRSSSD